MVAGVVFPLQRSNRKCVPIELTFKADSTIVGYRMREVHPMDRGATMEYVLQWQPATQISQQFAGGCGKMYIIQFFQIFKRRVIKSKVKFKKRDLS